VSWERCDAVAARVAAALLQQALRERCGPAMARVAATLRRCCYGAIAARRNDGKQRTMQQWQAALVLAATAGRWLAPNFFVFFFTRQFQRENESKTERKETGLRNLFPGSVGWQAPFC
jgi:hypothetical protein